MRILGLKGAKTAKNQCQNKKDSTLLLLLLFSGIFVTCQSKKPIFLTSEFVQLAAPRIEADSVLFRNATSIKFHLNQEGTIIRYSLDGSDIDSNALIYTKPLQLSSTSEVKVRAFHSQYKLSEVQGITVRKMEEDISAAEVGIDPLPNKNYPGNGVRSLIDGQKGSLNFRSGNHWLGFQEERISINLKFPKKISIQDVIVSVLQDQDSWIFAPGAISVTSNGNLIGNLNLEMSSIAGKKNMLFLEVPIQAGNYKELTITISPLAKIPDWHQGKGTLPWVFIDEVMVEQ